MPLELVPDAVAEVLAHFNGVHIPDEPVAEVRAIYERGAAGQCMMCEGQLAEETIVLVNVLGVVQLYCSHKCNMDMNVLGYLRQQYDDISEAVKFRGSDRHDG